MDVFCLMLVLTGTDMLVPGRDVDKRGPDSARLEGRRARARLSNEHFAAFLQAIKELNSGRQTREDTLAAAHDIFGPANPDLYASFDGALARLHGDCRVPRVNPTLTAARTLWVSCGAIPACAA